RTSQITAHDAFHRQRLGLLYDHLPPGEPRTARLQFFFKFLERRRDKEISNIVESLEPKRGNLIEHRALVRNWIGNAAVEAADRMGDDKKQCLAQVEHCAYLAGAQFSDSGEIYCRLRKSLHSRANVQRLPGSVQ